MENNRNVEEDIINAARKVFLAKGYKATTVRDIATEAKISKSMLNYYFRSKEKLFYIIFDEIFHLLYSRVTTHLLREDLDIFEKIQRAVDEYISFFNDNPQIPLFVAAEVNRSPEKMGERISELIDTNFTNTFAEQLQKDFKNGAIRQISGTSLIINILSLSIFPVIAKPVLCNVMGVENTTMNAILEAQKKEVAKFIIDAIKSAKTLKNS